MQCAVPLALQKWPKHHSSCGRGCSCSHITLCLPVPLPGRERQVAQSCIMVSLPCEGMGTHMTLCLQEKKRGSLHQQWVTGCFLLACLKYSGMTPWQPRCLRFRALKCCHNKVSLLFQRSPSSEESKSRNYRVSVIWFQLMISYNSLFVTKLPPLSLLNTAQPLNCGIRTSFCNSKERVPVCCI